MHRLKEFTKNAMQWKHITAENQFFYSHGATMMIGSLVPIEQKNVFNSFMYMLFIEI